MELHMIQQREQEAHKACSTAYNRLISKLRELADRNTENLTINRKDPDFQNIIQLKKDYFTKRKVHKYALKELYGELKKLS